MINLKNDSAVKATTRVLTLLTATMSAVSLIQKILNVGLSPIASDFIGYYRHISYLVFGLPAKFVGINIPIALIDFWAISFICAGAYVRSKNIEKSRAFCMFNFVDSSIKLRFAVFLLFGFSGLSLYIPLSALSITTYTGDNDITLDALKNLAWILMGIITFFIFNAFPPSV